MGWTVHSNQGHSEQRMLWLCRGILLTGFEMKRYESDPGERCTVEYVWMGHIVGLLVGTSVIMSTPVLVLISRWNCLRSLFCPAP